MANPEQNGEFLLVKLVGAEPDYTDRLSMVKGPSGFKMIESGEGRDTLEDNSALVEYWSYNPE